MRRSFLFGVLVLSLATPGAFGLSPRVFVASNGIDMGGCTRTAPCRGFAYAMTQVSASGEVVALDTAGYGPFSISQTVSVYAAPGATAAVTTPSNGTGITITAGASDGILLRNLWINGGGTASNGIDLQSGGYLRIQDSEITGFQGGNGNGINLIRSADGDVVWIAVDHCSFDNDGAGVWIESDGTGAIAHVTIRNSTFFNNSTGVYALDGARVSITDSTMSAGINGFVVQPNNWNSAVNAERCTVAGNLVGVVAGGGGAPSFARLAFCIISDNNNGFVLGTNGVIEGRTDGTNNATNTVVDNAANNTMPNTYPAQ